MNIQTAKSPYQPDLSINVGDVITFPTYQLRVLATDFQRNAFFPDAVAQVAIEMGSEGVGTHISTPYGMVEITLDERPLDLDDDFDHLVIHHAAPDYADAD